MVALTPNTHLHKAPLFNFFSVSSMYKKYFQIIFLLVTKSTTHLRERVALVVQMSRVAPSKSALGDMTPRILVYAFSLKPS
jgi:hypothetical protein